MSRTFQNPVLRGCYPDPSVCRVGDDFYMVTSTFSYFPGVPVFHSRDLVHWAQIGHAIHRPEQVELSPETFSGGLFAPTIRYHDGTFYVTVQNTSVGTLISGTNYIVTATDPKGPWSDPITIQGGGGDPSLFFDDDGRAYLQYSRLESGEGFGVKDMGIYQVELDVKTGATRGEPVFLWGGALADAYCPEAAHVYHIGEYYYLMIAEGGTEYRHSVTIARSRAVNGPYEAYPGNPVLTHRNLGKLYPICNVGHGDLVQLPCGDWYMLLLASRLCEGYHKNLGRETFLVPVIWEDGWPKASPETGRVEWEYPFPNVPEHRCLPLSELDDFDSDTLDLRWNFIGVPTNDIWRCRDSKLYLRMTADPICPERPPFGGPPMPGRGRPPVRSRALSYVARRQKEFSFVATTKFSAGIAGTSNSAGLCMMQNNFTQIRLEVIQGADSVAAQVVKAVVDPSVHGPEAGYLTECLGAVPLSGEQYVLRIVSEGEDLSFFAGTSTAGLVLVAEHIDGGFLDSETAGGYIGTYIGMFASGNGTDSRQEAAFEYFHCQY